MTIPVLVMIAFVDCTLTWVEPWAKCSGLAHLLLSFMPEGIFCCTEKLRNIPVAQSQRVVGSPWLLTPKAELILGITSVGSEGGGLGAICGWGGWMVEGLDLGAGIGVEGKGDLDKGKEGSRRLCRSEGEWRAGAHLA